MGRDVEGTSSVRGKFVKQLSAISGIAGLADSAAFQPAQAAQIKVDRTKTMQACLHQRDVAGNLLGLDERKLQTSPPSGRTPSRGQLHQLTTGRPQLSTVLAGPQKIFLSLEPPQWRHSSAVGAACQPRNRSWRWEWPRSHITTHRHGSNFRLHAGARPRRPRARKIGAIVDKNRQKVAARPPSCCPSRSTTIAQFVVGCWPAGLRFF